MNRLDPAAVEVPMIPVVSPTAMTHSKPRPNSPGLNQAHKVQPTHMGFLAAEHFSTMPPPQQELPQQRSERGRTRRRAEMGTFGGQFLPPQFHVSSLACQSKHRPTGEAKARRSLDDCSIKETKSSTFSPALFSAFIQSPVKESQSPHFLLTPNDVRSSLQDCFKQTRSNSCQSAESKLKGCISVTTEKKRHFETCAVTTSDRCEEECRPRRARSRNRGVDSDFFVAAKTEQTEDNHHHILSVDSSLTSATSALEPECVEETSIVQSCEDTMRKRSRRFPDAELTSNPNDSRSDEMICQTPVQEEQEFATIDDETPMGLRELRLRLFKKNHDEKTVPKARLSRALTELTIQDEAITSLQRELEEATTALQKSQLTLVEKDAIAKSYQETLNNLKAEAQQEKKNLEAKLLVVTVENSKLQTKVTLLQTEASRLRSALRLSKADLAKHSLRWAETKESEKYRSQSPLLSAELNKQSNAVESAMLMARRAEVLTLKSQLEIAQTTKSNNEAVGTASKTPSPNRIRPESPSTTNASSRSDVSRLRIRLSRTEHELREMKAKENAFNSSSHVSQAEQDLKEALAKARDEVAYASGKEEQLRQALESSMEKLKRYKTEDHTKLSVENKYLTQHLVEVQNEAQRVHFKATGELNKLRLEADDLKREVAMLTEKLSDAREESMREASERVKDRLDFTSKLQLSNQSNQALSDAVESLKEKLAKAESAERGREQRIDVVECSSPRRSVKRRIDEELNPVEIKESAQESFLMKQLEVQLNESRDNEIGLRREIESLKKILKQASERLPTVEANLQGNDNVAEPKGQALSLKVDELSAILASHESNASVLTEARNPREVWAYKKLLEAEVRRLKTRLEHTDIQMNKEISHSIADNHVTQLKTIEETVDAQHKESQKKDTERPHLERVSMLKARLKDTEMELLRLTRQGGVSTRKLRRDLGFLSQSHDTSMETNQAFMSSTVGSPTNWNLSPNRSLTNSEVKSSPTSPPEISKLSSQSSFSSMLKDVDISQSSMCGKEFRSKSDGPNPLIERTSTFPTKSSSVTRLEAHDGTPTSFDDPDEKDSTVERFKINDLQARMRESSKRLTEATFKLKGLIISSDELKEGQLMTQSMADDLTAIANRLSPVKSPTKVNNRVVSPEDTYKALKCTPSTKEVLEKYRKYKERKSGPDSPKSTSTYLSADDRQSV